MTIDMMQLVDVCFLFWPYTFYCFFEGGGVAKAQIPGYFTWIEINATMTIWVYHQGIN